MRAPQRSQRYSQGKHDATVEGSLCPPLVQRRYKSDFMLPGCADPVLILHSPRLSCRWLSQHGRRHRQARLPAKARRLRKRQSAARRLHTARNAGPKRVLACQTAPQVQRCHPGRHRTGRDMPLCAPQPGFARWVHLRRALLRGRYLHATRSKHTQAGGQAFQATRLRRHVLRAATPARAVTRPKPRLSGHAAGVVKRRRCKRAEL